VADVLTVESLSRSFGDKHVIDRLDLTIKAGDRVALHGPNGSGKTTLLRCIAGTVMPSSGSVRVLGEAAGSIQARRSVGVSLSLDRSFYLRLSGADNLKLFARLRGLTGRAASAAVAALDEEIALREILTTRADRCSTGMLQKLGFARALLGDPPLLLLDEPTRSLDDDARSRLWQALERRPAAAALIASHERDDLDRCGDVVELPR
jgi:ABC-type multidrug transport system ATPase subunit